MASRLLSVHGVTKQTSTAKPLSVTVVSDHSETLDGLCEYLRRAGVSAVGARALDHPAVHRAHVVICFPDDFGPPEKTIEAVSRLIRLTRLVVLVTAEPGRFEPVARSKRSGMAPILLPKPAWGSTILDAVRERMKA